MTYETERKSEEPGKISPRNEEGLSPIDLEYSPQSERKEIIEILKEEIDSLDSDVLESDILYVNEAILKNMKKG